MISSAMAENIDNLVLEQLHAVRQERSDSRKLDRELLARFLRLLKAGSGGFPYYGEPANGAGSKTLS